MALITSYTVKKDRNSMSGFSAYENGGKGSGNFGHAGRRGERGGSAPKGTNNSQRVKQTKKSQEGLGEWAKKNLTASPDFPNISTDEILARMTKGEDFYEMTNTGDSVDREAVFEEMSKRLGIDYDDIYDIWLGGTPPQILSYVDSLVSSPRRRELNEKASEASRLFREMKNPASAMSTKEAAERRLRIRAHTAWAGGKNKDGKWAKSEDDFFDIKERKSIINDEWGYLDRNVGTNYADQEVYAPSLAKGKNKNSLETEITNAILKTAKASGNI